MPVDDRPAITVPVQPSVEDACRRIAWLAEIFPTIVLSLSGTAIAYAREVSRYARRGFAIAHTPVRFGIAADTWTPAYALQMLTLTSSTVGEGGIVALPLSAAERDPWLATMAAYRRNGMRVYVAAPALALLEIAAFADGVLLADDATPELPESLSALWRGVVNLPTDTLKRRA